MIKPDEKNDASQLADLIDKLIEQGSGHINISCEGEDGGISSDTVKSNDCSCSKGACCQPTEFSDEDEEL